MRDPFRPNTKSQLVREAQLGLSVVAILLSLFLYVAFYRITGRGRQIPDHIRNAPVAKSSSTPGYSHDELRSLLERIAEQQEATALKFGHRPAVDRPTDPSLVSIESAVGKQDPSLQANAESYNQLASANVAIEPQVKRAPAQSRISDSSNRRSKTSVAGRLSSFLNGYGSKSKPLDLRKNESVAMTSTPEKSTPELRAEREFSQKTSTQARLPNRIPDHETNIGSDSQFPQFPRERNSLGAFQNSLPLPAPPIKLTSVGATHFVARSMSPDDLELSSVSAEPIGVSPLEPTGRENLSSELKKLPSIRPPMPDFYAPTSDVQRIPRLVPGDDPSESFKLDSRPEGRIEVGVPFEEQIERIEPIGDVLNNEDHPKHSATYFVGGDESLYSVAQAIYQDGKYFRALYKQNEEMIEQAQGKLTGLHLETPTKQALRKRWPAIVPASEDFIQGVQGSAPHESSYQFYTTQAGDTLFDISRRKLDQASRYLEIYNMNQRRLDAQTDPYSELPVGIKLILPRR